MKINTRNADEQHKAERKKTNWNEWMWKCFHFSVFSFMLLLYLQICFVQIILKLNGNKYVIKMKRTKYITVSRQQRQDDFIWRNLRLSEITKYSFLFQYKRRSVYSTHTIPPFPFTPFLMSLSLHLTLWFIRASFLFI